MLTMLLPQKEPCLCTSRNRRALPETHSCTHRPLLSSVLIHSRAKHLGNNYCEPGMFIHLKKGRHRETDVDRIILRGARLEVLWEHEGKSLVCLWSFISSQHLHSPLCFQKGVKEAWEK